MATTPSFADRQPAPDSASGTDGAAAPRQRDPLLFVLVGAQAVVLLGAGLQVLIGRQPRTAGRVVAALLQWSLPVNVGFMGLFTFLGHTLRAKETAESIGWPAGNPFQTEIGVANLSYGLLGLLCIRLHGLFWWAAAIGHGVFLWGAAVVHVRDQVRRKNFAPGNAGAVFYAYILTPLVHLALLVSHRRLAAREQSAVARRAASLLLPRRA